MPWQGRLYCLAEVKNEIRLLSLVYDQSSAQLDLSQTVININEPNWMGAGRRNILPIVGVPRRVAGLTPAIADGMMVCETASGSVVGYDVAQRQLSWGYSYESTKSRMIQDGFETITPFQVDEEEGRWLDNTPVITNDRVVITPRDSNELFCLNLIDGTLCWKRPRENGLYVALVHENKVVVVGRSQVMAYSLVDGSEAWSSLLEIPEPSGRGVREGSRYLLPLSTGEIATLDVTVGRIVGRSRLPGSWMPGNLAVAAGILISRGTHDVLGFRQLAEIEQQIAVRLAADSHDAEALAMRGELSLHRGDEVSAIQDLRESVRQKPQLRVKQILAETMLSVLKNDSSKILKAAPELEKLTDDPRQRIEFLHLYAKALGDVGDRVGAAQQLFRLAEIPELPEEPIQVAPGHFLSILQSLRSQLFTIYEQAGRTDRLELDRLFLRQFEAVTASKNHKQQLGRFLKLTVEHPAADSLLRHLAESQNDLLDETARTNLLERLTHSSNRSIGAFAVATLAKQSLTAGRPSEARPWIEQLGKAFPLETCEVGKTGRQLSAEWLARDDVRAALVSPAVWRAGPIEVAPPKRKSPSAASPIEIITHVGPHFEGWSFELDSSAFGLIARDPSLKVAWQLPLHDFTDSPRVQSAQLHIHDRTLAFSAGMSLIVMKSADPFAPPAITATISLRSTSLGDRRTNQILVERRLLPNGRRFQSAFDIRGSAGFLVGLSDEAVFYQLDNRLIAADTDNGRVLWYRVGPAFSKSSGIVDA
jgi:outer membrane protein assembly factor BamB